MEFEIDAQERDVLVRLVEQALGDTRVEIRRTSTPEFAIGCRRRSEFSRACCAVSGRRRPSCGS